MTLPRRHHKASFKERVAIVTARGEEASAKLAEKHDVDAARIAARKSKLLQGAAGVFHDGKVESQQKFALDRLHRKTGQHTLEDDFLEIAFTKTGFPSART